MSFNYPRSGLSNVAEYQASGLPWVTSSAVGSNPDRIDFPHVTNWVHIKQLGGGNLRFGWTRNGVNAAGGTKNYGTLTTSASFEAPFRVKTLYVRSDTATSASYEIIVGLTQILHHQFPTLTGSAVYPSGSTTEWELGYGQVGTRVSGSGIG